MTRRKRVKVCGITWVRAVYTDVHTCLLPAGHLGAHRCECCGVETSDFHRLTPPTEGAASCAAATSRQSRMRRFVLERREDVTGTSGTGVVAEGVVFSNGHVAYSWISPLATVTTCQSVDVVERLHGHEGRATIRFLDEVA